MRIKSNQVRRTTGLQNLLFEYRHRVPLVILSVGILPLLIFNDNGDHFSRVGAHNWVSSAVLARANNFSIENNFLVFTRQIFTDGTPWYEPYNRFPPAGYALIKSVTLPFEDLSLQIYAARVLMLIFFAATILLTYWSLCRLTTNDLVALVATMMTFSSYYYLYYSDMISTEVSMDLFAVMLTFHAIILYVQEARFRQLIIKVILALSIGWHVLGLIGSFLLLGLAKEIICIGEKLLATTSWTEAMVSVRSSTFRCFTSKHLLIGAVALGCVSTILAYNFSQEWLALTAFQDIAFLKLPSIRSMFIRTGLDPIYWSNPVLESTLAWPNFLVEQIIRLGINSIPFVFYGISSESSPYFWLFALYVGIVFGVCVCGIRFVINRRLWLILIFASFLWAMPMRYSTAFHEYEAIFYIGVPAFFFTLLSNLLSKIPNRIPLRLAVLTALIIMMISGAEVKKGDIEDASFHRAMISDNELIRTITQGENVLIPVADSRAWQTSQNPLYTELTGVQHGLDFYLSGSGIIFIDELERFGDRVRYPKFTISRSRDDVPSLLTPDNQLMFLYGLTDKTKDG